MSGIPSPSVSILPPFPSVWLSSHWLSFVLSASGSLSLSVMSYSSLSSSEISETLVILFPYFYIVEDTNTDIIEKFRLHGGKYIKHLTGGSALHMNLDEHLSKKQYSQLLNVAAKNGCNYFTFNRLLVTGCPTTLTKIILFTTR